MNNLTHQQKGSLLAFIGVMFITPDSLLIRLSTLDTWGLLFYRGAIPFVVVLLSLVIIYRVKFIKLVFAMGFAGILYAITFTATNITFIVIRSIHKSFFQENRSSVRYNTITFHFTKS